VVNLRAMPSGWAARHRPILNDFISVGCFLTIREPSILSFDKATGETKTPGALVYRGPGQIQENRTQSRQTTAGTQDLILATYWGTVPATVTSLVPDLVVTVDQDPNDPAMVGRVFVITGRDLNTVGLTARHFTAFENEA
jgi:hypothetical protein